MNLENLKTKYLGKMISFYEKIDSTQKEIWRKIKSESIKTGELIIAEIQTNGIGTHGRKWHTTEKDNIAFSFFIEANCRIEKLEGFTKEIAETIIKVFEQQYNIMLEIKEPNDITYSGKKVGGILTETKCQSGIVKYIVVGIGINTNQKEFNTEIKNIATSIKNEFKVDIDNIKIISEFCNLIESKIIKRIGE